MNKQAPQKIRNILDILAELVYLTIIFAVPLYFSFIFPTYNIFELAKTEIFRILLCLLLLISVVRFAAGKKIFFGIKKYFIIPLVFIVGLGLTLFFSTDISQSFFGSYDRQAGYLSYLYYFLWLVLVVYSLLTVNSSLFARDAKLNLERRIYHVLVAAAVSAFIVAVYGILQILGIDFLAWPEDPLLTKRTISTFGQPNFLASWLILVIPLSAYLVSASQKFLGKFFFVIASAAQIICLIFTSSRGGFVAFLLVALFFVAYISFFSKLTRARKFLIAACLFVLALLGLWSLNYFIPGRISSLIDVKSGSMGARLNFYQAASDAITKRPFFGYGLDNSGDVFISYYLPDWGIYGDVGATTDRAHNLILDTLLSSGFLGLLLYTLLYYYLFSLARDNIRQNKMNALSMALALGAAAYLLSLLFSFSIVAGEIYFWLFLSLLIVIKASKENTESAKKNIFSYAVFKIAIVLLLSAGAILGIVFAYRSLVADHYFNQLYYSLGREQYYSAFLLSQSIGESSFNPVNHEYYNLFLADKLSDFYPDISDQDVKKIARAVLLRLDKDIPERSYNNIYAKAKINGVLGNYDLARRYYLSVIHQAPYWPKTYLDFAQMLVREGRDEDAIAVYKIIDSSLPDINDSRYNELHRKVLRLYQKVIYRELGNIYLRHSNYFEAQKYFERAYRASISDYSLLKKIADTFYVRGDLKTAITYNERGAVRNPNDYNWFLSLAVLNHELGNTDKARVYLDRAIELAPGEARLLELRKQY